MSGACETEKAREQAENAVVKRVAQEWCGWNVTDTDCERLKRLFLHLKAGDPLPGGTKVAPEEPSLAMLQEGASEMLVPDESEAHDVYRAMLAAAGEPTNSD